MDGQRLVYQFVDVPKDVMIDCPMDMKVGGAGQQARQQQVGGGGVGQQPPADGGLKFPLLDQDEQLGSCSSPVIQSSLSSDSSQSHLNGAASPISERTHLGLGNHNQQAALQSHLQLAGSQIEPNCLSRIKLEPNLEMARSQSFGSILQQQQQQQQHSGLVQLSANGLGGLGGQPGGGNLSSGPQTDVNNNNTNSYVSHLNHLHLHQVHHFA